MPLRTSLENLTAFGLYRQGLLHSEYAGSVEQLCQRIGPVCAVPGVSAHLSIWARTRTRNPIWLEQALHEQRSLVRTPAMQSDLSIIPAEDYAAYHRVTESFFQGDLYAYLQQLDSQSPDNTGHFDISAIASRLLDVLSARGACTIEEMAIHIPELSYRIPDTPGQEELGTSRLGDRLVPAMCARGVLVRAETQGSWRSDHYRFAALSSWLPDIDLETLSLDEALVTLISRYLYAFGPATVGDMVHWMGAVHRHQIVAALYRLGDRVSRLELRDYPGEYHVLSADIDTLLAPPNAEEIANLLPPRDSYMMAYRDPARLVDRQDLDRIYDWAGDSIGVLLYDGRAAGIWSQRDRYDRVTIRTFDELSPNKLALIAEEARRMGQFMGQQSFSIDIACLREEP